MFTSFFYFFRKGRAAAPLLGLILLILMSTEVTAVEIASKQNENTSVQALENLETIRVVATGYTAGPESTGKSPGHPGYGITYSGVKVLRNEVSVSTIAADPAVFPIGTLLYIPDYGYAVVADTGSAIKGNRIDLYFETVEDVYSQWGKRTVEVKVIKRGTGKLTQAWLNQLNESLEVNKSLPNLPLEY